LELEKRIADELKRKQALLLRTPPVGQQAAFWSDEEVSSEEESEDDSLDFGTEASSVSPPPAAGRVDLKTAIGGGGARAAKAMVAEKEKKWAIGNLLGSSKFVKFYSGLNFVHSCEMTVRETKFPQA